MQPADRFWPKVDRTNGPVASIRPDLGRCWPWTAATDQRGYGLFWLDGKLQRAHRVAYALTVGPVKPGLPLIQFACDLAGCCNPAHYRPPVWDGVLATLPGEALATAAACRNGHRRGPGWAYRRPDGRIECRSCRAAGRRRSRARET